MKSEKNNKLLIRLSILILAIAGLCYTPRILIPWLVDVWYENLFWEECVKQDEQIPLNTELLISACTSPEVRGVPGGEVLFVHEKKTGEIYLLDLRTGEKKRVPDESLVVDRGIFLNSKIIWLKGTPGGPNHPNYRPHYILNLITEESYELTDLTGWYSLPEPPSDYSIYFRSDERAFLHHQENRVIALPSNFATKSNGGVIFFESQPNTKNGETLEMFLKDLQVDYEVIDFSLRYTEVPSPTGKYIANSDGIFLSGTDASLISGEYTRGYYGGRGGSFVSWYYDESGFVFTQGEYYYFQDSLLGSHFPLPRPILKFNLPVH